MFLFVKLSIKPIFFLCKIKHILGIIDLTSQRELQNKNKALNLQHLIKFVSDYLDDLNWFSVESLAQTVFKLKAGLTARKPPNTLNMLTGAQTVFKLKAGLTG